MKRSVRISIIEVVLAALAVTGVVFFSSDAPAPTGAAKSGQAPVGTVKHHRSTMIAGEVSLTPRKDSPGMDMVPVFESDELMLTVSEHARAVATLLVERRKLTREIHAVGKVHYNESGFPRSRPGSRIISNVYG